MKQDGRARWQWKEVLGYDALALLALSGLAVAQPLLDLFGKNPEFFVAADASRGQIVAFGIAIAFGVPLVCLVLELAGHAIRPTVGRVVHAVLIAVLGIAFGATVARQFDFRSTLPVVMVAVGVGALILLAERRTRSMRLGLRYLAVAPVLFLALFMFTSGTSRLLWEDEAEAATGVTVGNPKPIVMVVFDELPLASLITPEGTVNAERFPNFARLADHSVWFRNATSLSPNTPGSLPTIESGLNPVRGSLPTSIDYPRNLFTLLAGSYELDVTETITELCPSALCTNVDQAGDETVSFFEDLRRSLSDASVVYGHVTLPPDAREDLPAVDQSWGDFLDDADLADQGTSDTSEPTEATSPPTSIGIGDFMQERNEEMRDTQPQGRGELMRRMTGRISEDTRALYFLHDGLMPHFNWVMTPDQQVYAGEGGPPGAVEGTWGDDEFLIRQGQQRHLLQVGYADTLLGETIDRLEDQGVWDDALVVVTADHGISFGANQPKRSPTDENVDEVYRVPLFIKLPGSETAEVRDDNALLIDILPTLVDALDVDTDWQFDGRSLVGDEPPPESKQVFYGTGPSSLSLSLDGLLAVARRNEERFPNGDGWRGVAAVGPLGHLVGRPVDDLDVTRDRSASWVVRERDDLADVDLADGPVPLVLHGRLRLAGDAQPPPEALVVLNGTVAGVAGDFEQDEGKWSFRALLDFQSFEDGENTVSLLLPEGRGQNPPFREVQLRS